VPAAAVIPAPIAYVKVAVVKTLVVRLRVMRNRLIGITMAAIWPGGSQGSLGSVCFVIALR